MGAYRSAGFISQVPGELRVRIVPAFGQFGPDSLDLRVFDQDTWWVDRTGTAHHIEDMSADYVANVIELLTEDVAGFYTNTLMRESVQSLGDTILGRTPGIDLVDELGVGSLAYTDPETWLESTPLMRRLRRTAG